MTWFLLIALAAPAAAVPGRALAAEERAVEPAAERLLRAALERIGAAKSFAFTAEVTSESVLPSGQKLQFPGRLETTVRRPDGLRTVFEGERQSTRSWYDGKAFAHLDAGQNVYACAPGPARLDDFLATMKERLGFAPQLAPLLREQVAARALERIRTGVTVGTATLGGVPATHLAFTGENSDWQLWIAGGEADPVIKRIVITHKKDAALPQFTANFLAWDFAPALGDDSFAFAPPAGAVQCDFKSLQR